LEGLALLWKTAPVLLLLLARVMFTIDSRFRKRGYVLDAREILATMLMLTCNKRRRMAFDWWEIFRLEPTTDL
jgi:hypothetical protein